MPTPLSIFISYAREDERYLEMLVKHLTSLEREKLIAGWYDRMITGGRDWDAEIKPRLDAADIVLLLISSDFTGSPYCLSIEAERAVARWRENKARVIPVILRSVDWKKLPFGQGADQTSLGLLNALPKDARPVTLWADADQAFENITEGLRRVIDEIAQQRAAVTPVTVASPAGPPATRDTPPRADAPPRSAPQGRDAVQVSLDRLAPFLANDSVTWLLGSRAATLGTDSALRACEITRRLLANLDLVDRDWDRLLPPVDVAASYYAAKNGLTTLVQDVSKWIDSEPTVPAVHGRLATLLALNKARVLDADKQQFRPPPRNRQLVITTNLDLMMERALIAAALPFTRIVQYHSEPKLEVTVYRDVVRLDDGRVAVRSSGVPDALISASTSEISALNLVLAAATSRTVTLEPATGTHTNNQNSLESFSLTGLQTPILYKLRGSLDIPESCAVCTEQYLDFCLTMAERFVPTQIGTIVQHTPGVFLGYGYLDPDFRLLYYTFLRALTERPKEDRRLYSVQTPPVQEPRDNYRRMEVPIWEDLKDSGPRKARITTLEETSENFLDRLITRVDPTGELQIRALDPSTSPRGARS
jgi:hypothetical protein